MNRNEEALHNVRRKIGEVMKNDSTRISVGYQAASEPTRNEGDVWEDADGMKWTKKDGTIQNVTKQDLAKIPWFCPVCTNVMSHKLDTKFWNLRGKCFDCVVKEEMEMRRLGTWKAYEYKIMKANAISYLKDKIQELQHYHDTVTSPEIIHADDEKILMVEKWHIDLSKIRKDLLEDIVALKEELKKVEEGKYDENYI
jgi:hypothetical protein